MNTFDAAFQTFMAEAFEDSVIQSTRASWAGSGFSVEILKDGTYTVLWDSEIGNLYNSPGIILGIPKLGDEEWDEENDIKIFDNAEEYMREAYSNAVKEYFTSAY